ncbi:DUF2996 domain-containing protein [Acaryochloris sp. IP29b_bin.137]|uniref:DUF2996 domain-containing protein n=1 Tax=Acaryochloris sp. IP29b_bin.137 TaxID=2969217 RepID=UPI0026044590|nr:DUF2996 domain-containing protein [Acaryochloris sp. IP29b_bin.137]
MAEADKKAADAAPAAKPKEKKPKLEDKPFAEFIQQDYLPALEKALAAKDISDLQLNFADNNITGEWLNGTRQFTVYFPEGDIKKQRAFSWSNTGSNPSTIEPFLGDERKITLDLLVFGVIQRLNAQKWLGGN